MNFMALQISSQENKSMVALQVELRSYSSRVWTKPELRLLSVCSVVCSPHGYVGFLWVLCFPPSSQKHTDMLTLP